MNSISTIIKKLISLLIGGVSVIVLSLPNSFAYNQNVGSVNSPLSQPEPTFSSASDFTFYMVGSFTDGRGYELGEFHITGLNSSDKFCVKNGFVRSSVQCSISINVFDITNGTLLNHIVASQNYLSSPVDTFYYWSYGSIFAQINGNVGGLYYILPDSAFINVLGSNYSPPFVEWSNKPLDHNTYHSELSEPVADEYNSYFICNDRLYWLSYRANGLYSFTQNFELTSQISQESASFVSSGSGSYSGQSGGSTENVTAPYVIVSGSVSNGEVFNGSASSPNFGQIDYVGSSQGSLSVSSNGQMTYNDLDVYPVSVNSQVLNRLFDIIVYLTDDSGFKIWLVPRADLGQNLVLDASLFCSCFDLSNGEYISSSISSYTGSYQYGGFDYRVENKISDVRCYGCAFFNVNNIPVNLSDVFWQYDLEFKEWRDRTEVLLNQIYKALAGDDVETMTYTQPSWDDDLNEAEPATYISSDEMLSVFDSGLDSVRPSPDATSSITSWVNMFSVPKLIAAACFALAMGTIILTLGKKKSD